MFDFDSFKEMGIVLFSTPIYILLISIEIYFSNRKKNKYYSTKDSISNIYLMLLNMGLDILMRAFVTLVLIFFFNNKIVAISNIYFYWFALFILEDFAFYWLHRMDHVFRVFWAVHVTHHSSSYYNLTTGFRSSVFQPLYRFLYFIPIAFLGFAPLDIMIMYSVTQIYGILVHTQYVNKMGFLESFLVTPSHHRVHHASNIPCLDKNMGMGLIIWDKMFGTFQAEDEIEEEIEYGLTTKKELDLPVEIVTHEWKALFSDIKSTKGIGNKIKILFSPPGWTPTDDSHTSKVLQKKYWSEKK